MSATSLFVVGTKRNQSKSGVSEKVDLKIVVARSCQKISVNKLLYDI